jgi:hypothetical protein
MQKCFLYFTIASAVFTKRGIETQGEGSKERLREG